MHISERQIIDHFRRITGRIDVTAGPTTGNGSGLIIDNLGTVLTCHHVVRPYGQVPSRIEVVDENGSHIAQVVKLEQYQDLALLRSDGLRGTCEFKQFEQVEVGDKCLMFGYPLNMPHLSVQPYAEPLIPHQFKKTLMRVIVPARIETRLTLGNEARTLVSKEDSTRLRWNDSWSVSCLYCTPFAGPMDTDRRPTSQ